jgi:uncharacterized protein (TIGR00369 family)
MTDDHYRRLERMYLAAPCNTEHRPRIEVGEGHAEIAFRVDSRLHHAAGAVHGANYFKAMDDAAFFAVNSLVEDVFVLTVGFNLHLLRPIVEGEMRACGTVVSRSTNLWIADAVLTDGGGETLGRGTGSFMRSRIALVDVTAYASG